MNAVCAWCRADLGPREGPEGFVTHGICAPCRARVAAAASAVLTAARGGETMWCRYIPLKGIVEIARDPDRARGVEETIPLPVFLARPGASKVLRHPGAWVLIEEAGDPLPRCLACHERSMGRDGCGNPACPSHALCEGCREREAVVILADRLCAPCGLAMPVAPAAE